MQRHAGFAGNMLKACFPSSLALGSPGCAVRPKSAVADLVKTAALNREERFAKRTKRSGGPF
jgi:hypothetical protein